MRSPFICSNVLQLYDMIREQVPLAYTIAY
jgi:hypothetical protein